MLHNLYSHFCFHIGCQKIKLSYTQIKSLFITHNRKLQTQLYILWLLLLDIHKQHDTMTSNTVITPIKAQNTTMYIRVFSSRNEEAVGENSEYVKIMQPIMKHTIPQAGNFIKMLANDH